MRNVRAQFELSDLGKSLDRRYSIVVGDGAHSQRYTLAPKDQFSDPRWEFLLGEPLTKFAWPSHTGEGLYVTICRQYVNPKFDFSPEAYMRHDWMIGEPDVSRFRLYNPLFARACLNWPTQNGWGDNVPFSEGDSKEFAWSFYDWETKIEEKDVKYTVKRLDDSDDFKEFIITLN
jgi:hypothetical protein